MIVTTTHTIEGRRITRYHGIVSGETVVGTNIFRDILAGITDLVGGRSSGYEEELRKAKDMAIEEMSGEARALGAQAIVGVDLDYEHIGGGSKSMLMVTAGGTAVNLEQKAAWRNRERLEPPGQAIWANVRRRAPKGVGSDRTLSASPRLAPDRTGRHMERTGLRDGDVVASRATPEAKNDDVVGAQFSNAMALKRFVPLDESHVKLRPDNHNPEHEPSAIDLAKHILHIDGVAVERSSGGWATQETIGPGRNPDTATLRR